MVAALRWCPTPDPIAGRNIGYALICVSSLKVAGPGYLSGNSGPYRLLVLDRRRLPVPRGDSFQGPIPPLHQAGRTEGLRNYFVGFICVLNSSKVIW